ncbi:MAG: penicillin-binding protein 2 [Verrucomicrobiae bacterium]|nr:penicillin-binding protein 2 [Verrucomicrobiae bacterium]
MFLRTQRLRAPSDRLFIVVPSVAALVSCAWLAGASLLPAQEIETGAAEAEPSDEKTVPIEEIEKDERKYVPSKERTSQTAEDRNRPLSTLDKLERVNPKSGEKEADAEEKKPADAGNTTIGSSYVTRTEARTFTLSVPAPRGQILDRNGYPLAQNKVVYYAAVNFPLLEGADDTAILRYAGERIVHVNKLLGKRWDLFPDVVLPHYQNRRWLPLVFSDALSEDEAEKIRSNPMKGLMLHPVYLRHYPHGKMLSHVLGYVGKRPPRELGPIRPNEPLWGEALGVEGLEESFDTWLTGQPGRINMLFEADGSKLREEMVRRPRPGNNIVTSIDAEMQQIGEDVLAEKVHRGALVVMDVRTGDVLVMASFPQFDPNDFIPSISKAEYAALQNDPEKPLFPRAFRGAYPPASTFKVTVALAALEERVVSASTTYPCPTSWSVGDVIMRNWNKDPEGSMNVSAALMRSCNTWFYEVGTQTGADAVTMMARRLGMGEQTGLPLKSEATGIVPTNRWWREKYGYYMSKGDLANICIGQGQIEVTPVQVARAMAAVANRQHVLKPRLVKQIQDYNNAVIQSVPVEDRSELEIDPYYLSIVRKGMTDVVNAGRGTGHAAGNDKIEVAGKTGTGQWKPANEQNIGWFAGFAPADAPVISFAAIYEGNPGEAVGGGKNAAPIIGEFLERYLDDDEHLAEIRAASDEMKTLLAEVEPAATDRPEVNSIFRDSSVEEQYQQQDDKPQRQMEDHSDDNTLTRWFRRLRKR